MWCAQQRCWGVLAASRAATPNISNGPERLYLGNQIQPEVAWSCSALLVSHHFPSGAKAPGMWSLTQCQGEERHHCSCTLSLNSLLSTAGGLGREIGSCSKPG